MFGPFFDLHEIPGKKPLNFWWRLFLFFFFGLYLNSEKKVFYFWWRPFFSFLFWSSLNLFNSKKNVLEVYPPMLKIGQNWGKIANYPPNIGTHVKYFFAVLQPFWIWPDSKPNLREGFRAIKLKSRDLLRQNFILTNILVIINLKLLNKYHVASPSCCRGINESLKIHQD